MAHRSKTAALIMGHEGPGVIEESGRCDELQVGEPSPSIRRIFCGACKHGLFNLCDSRRVLGVGCDEYKQDGIFAEYAIIEERVLFRLPEGLSFEEAAMVEPAGVAAHALSLASPSLHEDVAVVGAGLIGLLMIKLLRTVTSGKIIALDIDEKRRNGLESRAAMPRLDRSRPLRKS